MRAQIWNFSEWVQETDPKRLYMLFSSMLYQAGFNVIKFVEHHFNPVGYTCLFLLGESHLAIHTFPEEEKTYIELSSCNKEYYDNFIDLMHGGR